MRCDFADSLLHLYFDVELNGRRAAEFERHMRHCDRCGTELVDLEMLRDRLLLAQIYEPATASLRRKINAALHAAAPTTTASPPRLWHWLAAAAALLIVALLLGRVGPEFHNDDYQADLAAEIVDAHARSLQPGHLNGIASNDARVVKGWLAEKGTFAVPVHDFANDGFNLKGGRLDVIEGRPVAVVVYEGNGHPIDVFIWPTRERDSPPRTGSRQNFKWVDWRKGKMEFCAVSDADPVAIEQLHHLMNSSW